MIYNQQNRSVILKVLITALFLVFLLTSNSFAEHEFDTYVAITNQTTDGDVTTLSVDIKIGNHTGADMTSPQIHFCEPISHEFHYGPAITTAVIADGAEVMLQGTISVPKHVADIYNKKGKLYLMLEYEHMMDGVNMEMKEMYSTPLLGPASF